MPDCPACQAPLLIFLLGKNGCENHLRDAAKMVCPWLSILRRREDDHAADARRKVLDKKRPPPLPPPQDHRPSLSPPASSPLSPLPPIPPITLYPLLSPYPTLSSMCSCGGSGLLLYIIIYPYLYYIATYIILYDNIYYYYTQVCIII